jgi:putative ABC transport system permease protein
VSNEISYDRFYKNADRIYRVNEFFEGENGSGERSSSIPFPMAETMLIDYPDMIESAVRIFNFQSPVLTVSYEPKERIFNERRFFFVDSSYYQLFDLSLVKGNPRTALLNSNAVVISESMARKYFDNEEPIGKLLRFQGKEDLLVTGVFKEFPSNTHFHPDFLASFSTLKAFYDGQYPPNWHWNPCWTYLLLKEANPQKLESRFPQFVQNHLPDFFKNDVRLALQSLESIHLESHLEYEIEPNGNKSDVYVFSGIAIFVLLIATINFVNLSTARSMKRAKEVGMRKAIGSQKHQLFLQFMFESVLISMISILVAIVIVMITLPYFNNFVERNLSLDLWQPTLILSLILLGLVVGLISGIYPAVVLTSFNAVKVLKSNQVQGKGLNFRKVLVTTQFVISTVLIIATAVAIKQVNYLQTSSVGFTTDHIVMLPVIGTSIAPQYKAFVDEAQRFKGIESITAVEEIVGSKHQGGDYQFEGMEVANLFSRMKVRYDFLKTFNIPLLAGRDYSIDNPTDDSLAVVVNETLIKEFKWTPENAIGKRCTIGKFQARIIGVTKDFNFVSKHEPVGSLVLQLNNSLGAFKLSIKYMAVRIDPGSAQQSIDELKRLWAQFLPDRPFDYFFLDHELDKLYKGENNLIKVCGTFAVLAVIVACLGLFGLASFNAEQRKREISIRKVLGGSVQKIILLILADYARLLSIAIVIACLIAWFTLDHWLTAFAYRIDIPLYVFALASFATISIALTTVGYKSYLVASSNPVDSLRSE